MEITTSISLGFPWVQNRKIYHGRDTCKNLSVKVNFLSHWWEGTMYTYWDCLSKLTVLQGCNDIRTETQGNHHTSTLLPLPSVQPLRKRSGLLDQWSLPFWRETGRLFPPGGLGRVSHNFGHWQKTWQCWVKQLYDSRQHTLHNHMGSLAFQAPWGWCRGTQVEATQARSLPHCWGTPQCLMRELCQGC